MKNKNKMLDIKLKEKVEREFKDFKNELKNKSKDEIIKSAYEIVSKEEIKNTLEYIDLHQKEKQALLKDNDLLNEFYHDWLNVDTPLGEVLENSIEESIAMVTRYHKSNQKER